MAELQKIQFAELFPPESNKGNRRCCNCSKQFYCNYKMDQEVYYDGTYVWCAEHGDVRSFAGKAKKKESEAVAAAKEAADHFSAGKNRLDLLSFIAIAEIGKVCTFGAGKYGDDNWTKGTDWREFEGSMLRHIVAYKLGEDFNPESGLLHLAHAAWNAMALIDYFYTHKDYDRRRKVNEVYDPNILQTKEVDEEGRGLHDPIVYSSRWPSLNGLKLTEVHTMASQLMNLAVNAGDDPRTLELLHDLLRKIRERQQEKEKKDAGSKS
jgi:hypothetical protein